MAYSSIKIEIDYRPCYIGDKKALFHTWGTYDNGYTADKLGLVEYEDGTMGCVLPQAIKFCDSQEKFAQAFDTNKKGE